MTCRLFKLPFGQEVGGDGRGEREGHHARRSHDLSGSPRKLHLRDKTKNARLENKSAKAILLSVKNVISTNAMKNSNA